MGFRSKRALRQRGLSCVQKEFVRKYQDASNRMRWMENDKMIANRFEQIRLTDEQQTNIKDMVYFINQITLSKTNTIKEFRMIGSLAKGLLLNSSRITVDLVAMVDHLPLKEEVPQIQREVNLLLSQIFQEVDVSAEVKRSRKGDLVIENKSDVNYSFNILLHCYNSIWLPAARKNQVTEEHVDVEHFVFVELAMLQVPWCQDNMDQQMKVLALILKDIKKRSRSLNVPHANVLHPWMLEWLSWCVKKELKMIYSRLTNAMYLELFLDQLTYPHSVFKILCPALSSSKKDCLGLVKYLKLRDWATLMCQNLIKDPTMVLFNGIPLKQPSERPVQPPSRGAQSRLNRNLEYLSRRRKKRAHRKIKSSSKYSKHSSEVGKPLVLAQKTFQNFNRKHRRDEKHR